MTDSQIRNGAILTVQRLWRRFGDAVPWSAIEPGFSVDGERIPLFSPFEGVHKPAQMHRGALSIKTTLSSRYED